MSVITPKRDLVVASLFGPDLKAWGLSRTHIIETPKSTYAATAFCAQAIHRASADIDGLIWTWRQCDHDQCIILFEDRVAAYQLETKEAIEVASNASLLLALRNNGQRASTTFISSS